MFQEKKCDNERLKDLGIYQYKFGFDNCDTYPYRVMFSNFQPQLLAQGKRVSINEFPSANVGGIFCLDVIKTEEAVRIVQHVLQRILTTESPDHETLILTLHNWLVKSKMFQGSPIADILWSAVSDALTLCTIKKAIQSHWLDVSMVLNNVSKLEMVQRFKNQILKSVGAGYLPNSCTLNAGSPNRLSHYFQNMGMSGPQKNTNACPSVPWIEWSSNICMVYIPTSRTLEVDITVPNVSALPTKVCMTHCIQLDSNPLPSALTKPSEFISESVDSASFAQCMALLLLGEELDLCDAVEEITLKVSVIVRARVIGSGVDDPEWHHIDIDDPIDIYNLKMVSPSTNAIISPIESILDSCKTYVKLYSKLKVISGINRKPTRTDTYQATTPKDTWRK